MGYVPAIVTMEFKHCMMFRPAITPVFSSFSHLLIALTLFSLTSCVPLAPLPDASARPESEPEPELIEVQPTATATSRVDSERLEKLLRSANRAMQAGRLSQPEGDNALRYFREVLVLEAGNAEALAGIDDIVLRYAEMVRNAMARNRWLEAYQLIMRAEGAKPGNPLVTGLQAELASARQRQVVRQDGEQILLPAEDLDRHSEQLSATLQDIARRIRESGESLLIVARSDAEGRWLYQQLKQAAGSYRIRGDISVGPVAKIVILPPL